MYLYGASGHARVIMDILRSCGVRVEGLMDDNPEVMELEGIPVAHAFAGQSPLIISIGSNRVRQRIAERVEAVFGTAVHPSAVVSDSCVIGAGTVVMHGAVLQAGVKVGSHCIVNTGATIDHECVLGDFVHVSPHGTLCGNVWAGTGSWIGAGATVIPGVRIGEWSVIGAGSVVTRDIPDNVVAYGNPCRIIKMNKKLGE